MNARNTTTVERFPFESLPAISRDELAARASLQRAAKSFVRLDAIADAITSLVGEATTITATRTTHLTTLDIGTQIPADSIGVAFAASAAASMSHGHANAIVVDVEAALACALVTRALKQRAPNVIDPTRTGSSGADSPEIAGALAALLLVALRQSHTGLAMRVIAAGPARVILRDLATASSSGSSQPGEGIATAWITTTLGREAFGARVSTSRPWLAAAATTATTADTRNLLSSIPQLPVAMPLVFAKCTMARAEMASLRKGDVLLTGKLVPKKSENETTTEDALTGPVMIAAASSERGLAGDLLAEDGRPVLRTSSVTTTSNNTTPDGDSAAAAAAAADGATITDVIEEAPVLVRVELGVVEMSVGAWAQLSPGDVIALGRKLGDPATLRVNGVEVARGELVQVDGEYGVQIVAMTTTKRERP